MKTVFIITLAIISLAVKNFAGVPAETPAQFDARMAWRHEAKFGMFIHWGVYSVPGGYYQGKDYHPREYLLNVAQNPSPAI